MINSPAYGIWSVTTEGDCEGRTTTNLGIHQGFVDEIAFKLADKCYYYLRFEPVHLDNLTGKNITATKVKIRFSNDSDLINTLHGRPVLIKGDTIESTAKDSKLQVIMNKLSEEEKTYLMDKLTNEI